MKIYIHEGNGHYVGSFVVVLAKNKSQAKKMIRSYLDNTGLLNEELDIKEFPVDKPEYILTVDGDY